MKTNVTVIILTYNEEENLDQALASICGWASQVLVLDSFSTDHTLDIAAKYECIVFQNRFENYAKQRNYGLENLPVKTEWVLFLDADEWVPDDLKREITAVIDSKREEDGFYIKYRLIWMGQWIRRGYYPTWILRLVRYGKARCERDINEHIVVDGARGYLRCDFIHEDQKGITDWIAKHNRYASREAEELLKLEARATETDMRFWGTQAQRKRWVRGYLWNRLPPLIRPFIYFFYRYVLSGGILDGKAGFIFHFLQGLWYILLIDIKYLELKMKQNR